MWYTGQKVVCVNASNQNRCTVKVINGTEYTITNITSYNNKEGFKLSGIPSLQDGLNIYYLSIRFVPLDILNTELNIEELLSNKV